MSGEELGKPWEEQRSAARAALLAVQRGPGRNRNVTRGIEFFTGFRQIHEEPV